MQTTLRQRRNRAAIIIRHVSASITRRRVGFVGYGKVGQFLVDKVLKEHSDTLELAFVCDPANPAAVRDAQDIPGHAKLEDLSQFESKRADLIVEVAHPDITKKWGLRFLQSADYLVASTSTFADPAVDEAMGAEAKRTTGRGVYLTVGALWGAADIQRMAERGSLKGLRVTMKKHPASLKLSGEMGALNEQAKSKQEETVLYEGSVRGLCPVAPNNVNTMATAAIAARATLGFDGTTCSLVADPRLTAMVIEVEAKGPGVPGLNVLTTRTNPAKPGAVTGTATFQAFLSSVITAATQPKGDGFHLC